MAAALVFTIGAQPARADAAAQNIDSAYVALQTALLKNDGVALRAMLAKDFQARQVDGSIQDAAAYVKEQIEPTPGVTISTLVIAPGPIQINGNNAQAEARYAITGTYVTQGRAKPLQGTIRTTDRWSLEDGRWKFSATTVHEIVSYVDGKQVQDDREDAMPDAAAMAEVQARAIAIPTLDVSADPNQFDAIGDAIGDARIVGMGEGSHGSSEFFAFKNRLFKYLVENKGFTVFAMEAAWGAGQVVDRYIKGGPGTAESAVESLEFWTWNTPEVLDLIRWMHDYNAKPGKHPILSFAGFDMQNPIAPANYASAFLVRQGASERSVDAAMQCVYDIVGARSNATQSDAAHETCRKSVGGLNALMARDGDAENANLAREALTNVLQYLDEGQGAQASESRDRDMADNVEWLATTAFPNAKIALWAHNYHIGNEVAGTATYPSMGSYLRRRFGRDYYTIGQTFGSGTVRAIVPKRGLQPVPVAKNPSDSLTALFGSSSVRFLDLRSIPPNGALSTYFADPHAFSEIGAMMSPQYPNQRPLKAIPKVFDGIVYAPISTAATWGVSSGELQRDVVEDGVHWVASGPDYDAVTISSLPSGSGAALRNDDALDEMSNALYRRFDAAPFLGRTVRIAGEVERDGLKGFANPYARIVNAKGEVIAGMPGPTVDSSNDGKWVRFAITMKVPKAAQFIEAGVSIGGPGTSEVRDVTVNTVASVVASASATPTPAPAAMPLLTPPPALFASSPAVVTKLDTEFAALTGAKTGEAPSLQVAIAQGGRIVYERAFGAVATTTRFPIASITKMFTAVSIMQLVEEKRVNLDAAVATYMPSAPYANQITVRQLLQHTSGLWNYGDYAVDSGLATKATAPDAILQLVATHPLTSTPGTSWAYSNSGYVLLARIVERVSGEPLAKYEREHIFGPAGMTETTIGAPPDGSATAPGYMSANGPPAANYDRSWFFGCGDILSTAGDLARFDLALMNGTLVSAATFAQMQADVVPALQFTQGLGLTVVSSGGMTFVGHHGGLPGYETQNETIPVQGVAWVVLSDAFDFGTYRADRIVIGSLFPSYIANLAAAMKATEDRAVTKRFVDALTGLMRGSIDRSQYSDTASAALTPQLLAQSSTALDSLGDVTKVEFMGANVTAQSSLYEYRVSYSSGKTLNWSFVLDAQGKIAEILGSNPT